MKLEFSAPVFTEAARALIAVPFNVWEETGLKGCIPCRIQVDTAAFECKLLPKGNGRYLIPVPKAALRTLAADHEYPVVVEPIPTLTRINHDSPYSRENPVRRITSVDVIPIRPGLCGHCCIAMLAGVPLAEVTALMGSAHASWSKLMEALDYYGIAYAEKHVYTRGRACSLPDCCIVLNDQSFLLWYRGAYCGCTDVDPEKTVGYLEILTGSPAAV